MAETYKPVIAITMGDPCGIGPEVIAKALASGEVHASCRPVVVGSSWSMEQAVKLTGAPLRVCEVYSPAEAGHSPELVEVVDPRNLDPGDVTVGKVSPSCGKAAMGVGVQGSADGPGRGRKRDGHRPCEQGGRQPGRVQSDRPHGASTGDMWRRGSGNHASVGTVEGGPPHYPPFSTPGL